MTTPSLEQTRLTATTPDAATLVVESFGDPSDPAVLLIPGACWSMDWWHEDFCRLLAAGGRRVIRYDQRDTGESTTSPPGHPAYSAGDLMTDALAILDAARIESAHIIGLSMGGGFAQHLAVRHPDRVATLVLMSSSPASGGDLPGPTEELSAHLSAGAGPDDWTDTQAVIDYLVEEERAYAGPHTFDAEVTRALAETVTRRSRDVQASMTNHFAVEEDLGPVDPGDITQRTLVIHGTDDPLFPLAHGRALAELIPGARLVELDGVGHQLAPRPLWGVLVREVLTHTRTAE